MVAPYRSRSIMESGPSAWPRSPCGQTVRARSMMSIETLARRSSLRCSVFSFSRRVDATGRRDACSTRPARRKPSNTGSVKLNPRSDAWDRC